MREGRVGAFLSFWGAEATRRMQRVAVEESRLHIPLLFGYDVIHGLRTIFPVSARARRRVRHGRGGGRRARRAVEASAHGVHWTFAPMVDIARDARWGRVVEGAGEDPYLGCVDGRRAGARLSGRRTSPTPPRSWRPRSTSPPTARRRRAGLQRRRRLRAHDVGGLPPALRGGGACRRGVVMASFNEIGGTPAHASRWLLADVLRRRWGFRRPGGERLDRRRGAAQSWHRRRRRKPPRALGAGVDMEMSSTTYIDLPRGARPAASPWRDRLRRAPRAAREGGARLVRRSLPLQRRGPGATRDAHGGAPRRGPRDRAQVDRPAQERAHRRRACPAAPRRTCARSPSSDRWPTTRARRSDPGLAPGSRRMW